MKKRFNYRVKELIYEIIPVMIGVFLGFLVSNWAENSKNKSKTTFFKKNLIAEIQRNKQSINSVIDYHVMLKDSTNYYSKREVLNEIPIFFKGIRTRTLTNSAFETGIQTGLVNELTFEQIQLLNHTYNLQDRYNEFSNLMLTGLLTMDFNANRNDYLKVFRFLAISMTDVVIKENELLGQYNKVMAELNSE